MLDPDVCTPLPCNLYDGLILLIIHFLFVQAGVKPSVADPSLDAEQIASKTEIRDKEETFPVKRKKALKKDEASKKKKAVNENEASKELSLENDGLKKNASIENEGSKMLKSKKRSKRSKHEVLDDAS